MKIIDKIREMLGDDFDKNEIMESLEAEVMEAKLEKEQTETLERDKESLDWAQTVMKARAKQHERIKVRHSLRHQKHINPGRIVRLKRDGKL